MEKIKNSRAKSFITVAIIYLIAIGVGIIVFEMLPFNTLVSLLIADIISTVFVFMYSVIFSNASVYDPYWSVIPCVVVIYAAITQGFNVISTFVFIAVLLWGIRLTANWAYTFNGLNHQDWRYTMLNEKTGKLYPLINFVGIHLVPTLVVYGCIVPCVMSFTSQLSFNAGSLIFFILAICAVALQGTSDYQMHKYKKNRNGPFIRNGLWKYCRHPNYLGEISMWWATGLCVVCAMPQCWYILLGALANTLLFVFVSIPMAEKKQSKKEGFEQYKKETRYLFPIPKKAK